MASIYELYGRLMEEREAEHVRHLATIAVLRGVATGDLDPSRIEVGDDDSWCVLPVSPSPHLYATTTTKTPTG